MEIDVGWGVQNQNLPIKNLWIIFSLFLIFNFIQNSLHLEWGTCGPNPTKDFTIPIVILLFL